jgi:hypothetical protein
VPLNAAKDIHAIATLPDGATACDGAIGFSVVQGQHELMTIAAIARDTPFARSLVRETCGPEIDINGLFSRGLPMLVTGLNRAAACDGAIALKISFMALGQIGELLRRVIRRGTIVLVKRSGYA